MQQLEMWRPFSWHCPNCGTIAVGYQNDSGTIKVECSRCHTVMVASFVYDTESIRD